MDTLYSILVYVLISAAGERARRAAGRHMQVLPALLILRDLPSIIPNHPTHAQRCLCTVHGPISLVTVCASALLAQVSMRVVGGTGLHHFNQLASELWQPHGASLGVDAGVF